MTFTVIKADVGSIGGHTRPSDGLINVLKVSVEEAKKKGLIIDGMVTYTGDDGALLLSHTKGVGAEDIHKFAWDTFMAGTAQAKLEGLYGAGQDMLKDAFSGNVRGLGPGVAEIDFELRPSEAIMVFAADKTSPGAYNLPLYLSHADPMFCGGLLLSPEVSKGFTFTVIDMDHTDGDRIIELNTPEDQYALAALLRDNERFAVESIRSRAFPDQQCVSVSATRLHNISGVYSGKDDPVAVVRVQKPFIATEESVSPYVIGHFVGGDARGSHVMPIMPMPINSPVVYTYCTPIVTALAISMDGAGKFSNNVVDVFGNMAWDEVRAHVQRKAIEMRRQGFSGAAMLPMSELEYGGITKTLAALDQRFQVRKDDSLKSE